MSIIISVTQRIPSGSILSTPSGKSHFEVAHVDAEKILVKTSNNNFITIISSSLQDTPKFLQGKGWVKIGASHSTTEASISTFDDFLKTYNSGVSTASYVVSILEKIGIIEVNRVRPAKIRLRE
jgi:hypothetical protein